MLIIISVLDNNSENDLDFEVLKTFKVFPVDNNFEQMSDLSRNPPFIIISIKKEHKSVPHYGAYTLHLPSLLQLKNKL